VLLAVTGCEDPFGGNNDWSVGELDVHDVGDHHDVEVVGGVMLMDGPGGGTTATAEFYTDDYQTLIDTVDETIGADITEEGHADAFEIGSDEVWLLPATGGYERVCVKFMADGSNYPTLTELNCIPFVP
jgi:hypothetical protein